MTTIATNGHSMAADGLVTTRTCTIVDDRAVKLFQLKDGRVLGVSGKASDGRMLADWLDSVDDDERAERPEFKDSEALVLGPEGVTYLDDNLVEIAGPRLAAIGSGKDHALTAMDMGAPPELAVELAGNRDPFTGGRITVMSPS